MSPERLLAIADTCFLIDWARYRRRDLLARVFNVVFIPEDVLDEVRSENTIEWIAESLSAGWMALYTPGPSERAEALELVEKSRMHPQLPGVDLPEALCLVAGRRRGYIVLTENRGAIIASRILPGYRDVRVWRALEVLVEAARRGVIEACSDPEGLFEEYSRDTLHVFPRRALEWALGEVRRYCQMRS